MYCIMALNSACDLVRKELCKGLPSHSVVYLDCCWLHKSLTCTLRMQVSMSMLRTSMVLRGCRSMPKIACTAKPVILRTLLRTSDGLCLRVAGVPHTLSCEEHTLVLDN